MEMALDDFEALERGAPETVRLEFIAGRLVVKPMSDGDHATIFMWVLRQCMQQRPELALYPGRGLEVERDRVGRARVDGALAPVGTFAGDGEWSDPAGVLMVLEVTSHDFDTNRRIRREKRDGYAAAGIPVFLLIDRDRHTLTVHSEPEDGTYRLDPAFAYGTTVKLPDPVGITLDTEALKDYAA
ncbi:Uma2 family endonuclease [Streptomyces sp. NBC_01443]|uniref:Uma2 family endonuclease n=1 Tax=Streptomyces sp. NBC_01443 TaxID=2903868 RepID=UPI00225998F7|nr:Uma2 family endonuclease [Streptomyces sp. NBC_01443]MCX4629178.1 Uma2 family endonuclease [Streptomyces sp. NBC_01443]